MKITAYFANLKTANETTDGSESLSDLVLNSGSNDVDKRTSPLAAANPMVSGIGDFEEITDFNCSVTVKIDNDDINKAEEIIKDMGGELENP